MAEEDGIDAPATEPVPRGRHHARTAAKWAGIVLLVLVALVGAFFLWLNSDLGRDYVVKQINNLETASGLDIEVGRIEGSVLGELTLHDIRLADPKGVFFTAPRATVDWRPFAYFQNHIDIKSLEIPRAHLMRLPELKPGDPDAPLLPDIDIDIGRFQIERILVDPAVTGYRHLLGLSGGAKIADGRAQVALDAGALEAPGMPGGDKLVLRLDAVPEANRLDLGLRVDAPAGGFIAGVAGLDQDLLAVVTGDGSWSNWNGRARALLGGTPFANLSLGAQDGTFRVTGPLNPGLILEEGMVAELLGDQAQVDLVTTWENRRADGRLRLSSAALGLAAEGVVDLGENEFDGLKVAARLRRPGAVLPNLQARDLRFAGVLNGKFATPTVAYDVRADSLGHSGTVLHGFRARGRARIEGDRTVVPISARAARITGLDPALGGLLTNVSVDGTLYMSGPSIVSDNLRVRSDKLNATVVMAANTQRGQYRFGIDGTIDNYEMEGIGLLDITTDMDVTSGPGGFGLAGRVAVRTERIDNESARNFLGGQATASAQVRMTPDGTINFSDLRLNSPGLRLTSGSGVLRPNGQVELRAAGVSRDYGPVAVVVGGTIDQPRVRLRLQNPGFGIGLSDVDADIQATADGYRINATGLSQYGPFEADVTIRSGAGPMTIDIHRLLFAGMEFEGQVRQTAAGPFAGTLNAVGEGLTGTIQLGAAGQYQRIEIHARANGARIPATPPILIQRGLVDATIILYPDAPHIVGDAQLAGVRSDDFFLSRARVKVDYRGGNGTAQLFAEGTRGVPFRIAANAALSPDLYRVAATGQVNRIPFRLARPAEIRNVDGEWQLSPTQIVLPQGRVLLAGRYGDGLVLQSRFTDFDISILNAFSPGLGLSGTANGSIDFAQPPGSDFPRADARLNISNFTRAGIATRSPAVDLALAGALRPDGGALNAVIRRSGAVIGRAQVRLQPLSPAAGPWTTRLLASPLSGGIRYNGPAEVLWTFTGLTGQQLSGPIGVAADFSGRVQDPQLAGVIRANNLTFVDETYGTRITNLALDGRFTSSRLEITRLAGRAGEGTITGRGTVGFAADAGYPIDIRLVLDDARLARSDNIGASVSGEVAITNSLAEGALISGDLRLPEVRYQIVTQGAAQVVELAGVRRKGEPLRSPDEIIGGEDDSAAPSIWNLDLRVRADNRVFISGMGLESEWSTDLRVEGTSATPRLVGQAELIRGTYSFSGRRFEVTNGDIVFTGSRPPNPRIDIDAEAEIDGVTINLGVSGSALNPQIAFTSSPALPQDEIMARILFGGSVTEISALQAVQLAASLNALRGGGGGLNPLGKLRSATGFDRLRILGADETTGRGTAVAAGFYISNDIYIELITDARGFTATQLEIALSKTLSALLQAGSFGGSAASVRYRKEY